MVCEVEPAEPFQTCMLPITMMTNLMTVMAMMAVMSSMTTSPVAMDPVTYMACWAVTNCMAAMVMTACTAAMAMTYCTAKPTMMNLKVNRAMTSCMAVTVTTP